MVPNLFEAACALPVSDEDGVPIRPLLPPVVTRTAAVTPEARRRLPKSLGNENTLKRLVVFLTCCLAKQVSSSFQAPAVTLEPVNAFMAKQARTLPPFLEHW